MFYIFTTNGSADIRMSPSRAAESIRRVFGYTVSDVACVYCTKQLLIFTADTQKQHSAVGGIVLVCQEALISSTLPELVLTDCRVIKNRVQDFNAMLGRLNFNESSHAIRKKYSPKANVDKTPKPKKRYKSIYVTHRFKPQVGRLMIGSMPEAGTENTVDLSVYNDVNLDVRHSFLFGCQIYDKCRIYRDNAISDFLSEQCEAHGMLSATRRPQLPL